MTRNIVLLIVAVTFASVGCQKIKLPFIKKKEIATTPAPAAPVAGRGDTGPGTSDRSSSFDPGGSGSTRAEHESERHCSLLSPVRRSAARLARHQARRVRRTDALP
jgi:hypothetical protein